MTIVKLGNEKDNRVDPSFGRHVEFVRTESYSSFDPNMVFAVCFACRRIGAVVGPWREYRFDRTIIIHNDTSIREAC